MEHLTNRDASRVLIGIFIGRARSMESELHTKKLIALLRFYSNEKLIKLLNDKAELDKHLKTLR